jgi:hypothetical protein
MRSGEVGGAQRGLLVTGLALVACIEGKERQRPGLDRVVGRIVYVYGTESGPDRLSPAAALEPLLPSMTLAD